MPRIVTSVFIAMAMLWFSNLARAQEDYSRAGCYLGLGGAVAFPLRVEEGVEGETRFSADVDDSLGLNARGGCRGYWGGAELHFEWLEGFDVKGHRYSGEGESLTISSISEAIGGWALTVDGKLYLREVVESLAGLEDTLPPLARRFQPFATVGFGYLTFDRKGFPSTSRDSEVWDFAVRYGFGLDVYLTRNIAISVDVTHVFPVSDSLNDLDYNSIGWGLLYRF